MRRLREMTTPSSPPPPPPPHTSSSNQAANNLHLGLARLKSADDSLPPPDYATVTIETEERHLAPSNSSMQGSHSKNFSLSKNPFKICRICLNFCQEMTQTDHFTSQISIVNHESTMPRTPDGAAAAPIATANFEDSTVQRYTG